MLCTGVGVALADPSGLWLAGDGARLSISSCGNELCGVLVHTASPLDPDTGRPWTDKNNADPHLQNRPLVGVHVLIAMRPNGAGTWSGRLYNIDDGKTYDGNLRELDARTIRVEGCAATILCGGENMTRIK
jgi:uncharacterized protein (DUF2147 family)